MKFGSRFKRNARGTSSHGQSRNTSVPRISEQYIKQLFEEFEGGFSKKLSPEFSRTESPILGALSKLDEPTDTDTFRNRSGKVPEDKRGKPGTKWGSFPGWSSSWSGTPRLSVPSFYWFRHRRGSSHYPSEKGRQNMQSSCIHAVNLFFLKNTENWDIVHGKILQNFHATWKIFY